MSFTLSINGARAAQVVIGGAALFGGYKLASSMVRTAYREDLLGDPTRIVEIDDKTMIYQTREAQGGKLTNFTMGAGAAAAFAGGALVLGGGGVAATGIKNMLRLGGGAALFALGLGAIAGATATSAQYQGSNFEPVS
jgi:hypothetical protein